MYLIAAPDFLRSMVIISNYILFEKSRGRLSGIIGVYHYSTYVNEVYCAKPAGDSATVARTSFGDDIWQHR
jgi:hypothetical protein